MEHGAWGMGHRAIQLAAVVKGWRSGPAGLEVGGKTEELVVRCQWSVAAKTEGMEHGEIQLAGGSRQRAA